MDAAGDVIGVLFVLIVFGFIVFTVVAMVMGFVAPAPSIDGFSPKVELTSSITNDLATETLIAAVNTVAGMKVVERRGSMILVSVKPAIRSLEHGTGSWVRILPGSSQLQFQISSKSWLNLTMYSRAITEIEREIRLALTKAGAISFDVYENVAVPTSRTPTSPTATSSPTWTSHDAGPAPAVPPESTETPRNAGGSGKWWET